MKKNPLFESKLISAFLLLTVSCQSTRAPLSTPTVPPHQQSAPLLLTPASNPATPSVWTDIAALAVEDLSNRLNIPAGQIAILEVTSTQWEDTGLGCPFPNVVYSPGPVPGLIVDLNYQQETYSYHTDLTGRFILCGPDQTPQLPLLPVTPGDIQDGGPWIPVTPPD